MKTTIPEAKAVWSAWQNNMGLENGMKAMAAAIDLLREASAQEAVIERNKANNVLLRDAEQRHAAELAQFRDDAFKHYLKQSAEREAEARAAAYEEAAKVADVYRESCYTSTVNDLGEDIAKQIRQLAAAEPLFDAGPWVDRAGRLHEASGQRDSFSFREFL